MRKASLGAGSRGVLLSAVALILSHAAPVQAAPPVTITDYGQGAGEVVNPLSVAVDPSGGDLYVADRNNFRVGRFDSEGGFLLSWGFGVRDGTSAELQTCGPEASPEPTIRCFGPNLSSNPGPGNVSPQAVAVDADGDVWVADNGKRRVTQFSRSGEFLLMVGREVNKTDGANLCTAEDLADDDECGAGLKGTGEGEFDRPRALAIDSDGDVWVGDTGRLQELNPDGSFASERELPGAGETTTLAIDPAGSFYLKSAELPGIRKLHPDGTPYGAPYPLDAGGLPRAVTVDSEGNAYVGDATSPYRLMAFDAVGAQVSQFGAGQVLACPGCTAGKSGSNALAVDEASGRLYVGSGGDNEDNSAVQAFEIPTPGPLIEAQEATEVLPTTATLRASLNPEGEATEYRFEYVSEADWEADVAEGGDGFEGPGTQATSEAPLSAAEFEAEEVEASIEGLIPDTAYRFRLVAINADAQAEGEATPFTTRRAVGIEAQWASEVAATGATLNAELDPLGADEAKWWVQYGAGETFDKETEHLPLDKAVSVSVALAGLAPGTTYRYRFVAEGKHDEVTYPVEAEPQSFVTELAGLGSGPPDLRAWEMVSPPDKSGGRVGLADSIQGGAVQAAASGEALAYLTLGSVVEDPEGNRLVEASSALARRGAGGAWRSQDITPPHTEVVPFRGFGAEHKLFSEELEYSLLEPRDAAPLASWSTERTPYLRENASSPRYTPLVVGCPALPEPCPAAVEEHANVPAGTQFGGEPANDQFPPVTVRGASADLSHVVLRSEVLLAGGATNGSLYEWAGGALEAVSVLPGEGEEVVSGELGGASASVRNAVSTDGARVFWGAREGDQGLYVRDTELGATARLDTVQGGFGVGATDPVFQGASAAGDVAFFTDSHQLTANAGEGGRDLYRCEISVEEGKPRCQLSNVSGAAAEAIQPGASAEVQDLASAISEDGARVYLVARGVLDAEPNRRGQGAAPGQPNLYAWSEAGGARFVATLDEADSKDWGFTGPGNPLGSYNLTAVASPSGRYLAFMSRLPLTGYDNRDAASGERAQEVFRYDAATDELICASCNPTGARPQALRPGEELALEFDPLALWSGEAVAALLPEAVKTETSPRQLSLRRPRAIHDNGRLYFNAADGLVPADSNGDGDVYQYEPLGVGSCDASAPGAAAARAPGGCVALVSGAAEGTAAFLDASVGGDDVFFYTPAQLSATDIDDVLDVYDARVGGVAAGSAERVECLGEACQPPPAIPEVPTPASAAFRGPGNPRIAPRARRCARSARRAKQTSKRAKRARRAARRAPSSRRARRMWRKARSLAAKAKRQSSAAKRCRRRALRKGR